MSTLEELWQRWDDGGRQAADLSALVAAAEPFVAVVIRSIRAGSEHLHEDMIAEGNLGLMKAILCYDPGRGVKFESFAQRKVRGNALDGMRSRDPLSRAARPRANALTRATDLLTQRYHRAPLDKEIAGHLGWTEAEVHEARMDILTAQAARQEPLGAEAAADEGFAYDAIRERMAWALDQLTGADRAVMVLYYLEGLPMSQVSEVLGVTTSMVSRIRDRAAQQVMSLLRSR